MESDPAEGVASVTLPLPPFPVIPRRLDGLMDMCEEPDEGQFRGADGVADRRSEPTIRVVIVDDYPFFRFGLRELLNAEVDIEVVAECADGQEAVDLAGQMVPDVVVTDLKMPRLDGADTTRRLLQIDPDVAVVVITSAPHGRSAARATAAGAHAVLGKDVSPSILVATVRTAYANALRSAERPT